MILTLMCISNQLIDDKDQLNRKVLLLLVDFFNFKKRSYLVNKLKIRT
jgi:hypothetical protein